MFDGTATKHNPCCKCRDMFCKETLKSTTLQYILVAALQICTVTSHHCKNKTQCHKM